MKLALLALLCLAAAQDDPLVGPPRDGRDYTPPPLQDLHRKHKVRAVYFLPTDREPVKDYREKFEVLLAFVSDVFRRDLSAKGYPCRGLDFEFADDRRLKVNIVRGKSPASHYNGEPNYDGGRAWGLALPEIEEALGRASRNVFMVLTETYAEGPWKQEWPGHFALGSHISADGGCGMFSGWVLRDEFTAPTLEAQMKLFADETPIKGRRALGDGRMDSPRYQFVEDGFGAVAHELGHVFGAPHDTRPDNASIMANGFRRFRANYLGRESKKPPMCFTRDTARVVAASRFLSDTADLEDKEKPAVTVTLPERLKEGATEIKMEQGRATDNRGLAAILVYVSQGDSARGGLELKGTEAPFEMLLKVPPLKKGPVRIEISVVDLGGNIRRHDRTITVE